MLDKNISLLLALTKTGITDSDQILIGISLPMLPKNYVMPLVRRTAGDIIVGNTRWSGHDRVIPVVGKE